MTEPLELEEEHEGADLCLCCLAPTRPVGLFCDDCGAPLGFIATALPFERTLAEGFLLRRAIQEPRHLLTVVGIWCIFGGYTVLGGIWVMVVWDLARTFGIAGLQGLISIETFGLMGFVVIGLLGVVQVTRNYIIHLRRSGGADQEPD